MFLSSLGILIVVGAGGFYVPPTINGATTTAIIVAAISLCGSKQNDKANHSVIN
jgi:hypothetical protein